MKADSGQWRTRAVEDFLRTVYILQQTTVPVPTTLIGRSLHVKAPSVSDMIQRLGSTQAWFEPAHHNGPPVPLLEYTLYHGVRLTEAGEAIALQIIRRRRLLELYLVQRLGYTWDEVEADADRLEHAVSDQLTARLAAALGNPEADPHGEPIPTAEGKLPMRPDLCLSDLTVGQRGRVSQVTDHSPELLNYLAELGLHPGAELRVLSYSPLGDTVTIQLDTDTHVLSTQLASHLRLVSEHNSTTRAARTKPGLATPRQK